MNVKTGQFHVCVRVHLHVRIHVQGYACLWGLCTRRSKSTSSVIPQVPPTSVCLFPCCLFETRSLFGLGIVRKSKLAGQWAPRIPVSTFYPWCWDYKCVPRNTDLLHNCREQSQVLMLAKQSSTLPTHISSHPLKWLWSSLFFDLITRKLWELRSIDMSVLWLQKPKKIAELSTFKNAKYGKEF